MTVLALRSQLVIGRVLLVNGVRRGGFYKVGPDCTWEAGLIAPLNITRYLKLLGVAWAGNSQPPHHCALSPRPVDLNALLSVCCVCAAGLSQVIGAPQPGSLETLPF